MMQKSNTEDPYKKAYEREKKARLKAEEILENKTRELFLKNQHLKETNNLLQQQQSIMLQNEKLATLGTLTAGMAHEINNPLAFVKSNFESLSKYHNAYAKLIAFIKQESDNLPKAIQENLAELFEEEDIEFIQEDLPELMEDTAEGLARVRNIVANLRRFSRTQSAERSLANLNEGIESTLKLLHSELKSGVNLELNLQSIPDISCNPNELNQVFLNLIINAKQATKDQAHPSIEVTSQVLESQIVITIRDNGCGMSTDTQEKIFVPFFTTKAVGEGTGMGLAIAYGIIQDHHGEILVSSAEGQGTTFTVKLPIN
jgi:signal transduction histidine kinase